MAPLVSRDSQAEKFTRALEESRKVREALSSGGPHNMVIEATLHNLRTVPGMLGIEVRFCDSWLEVHSVSSPGTRGNFPQKVILTGQEAPVGYHTAEVRITLNGAVQTEILNLTPA